MPCHYQAIKFCLGCCQPQLASWSTRTSRTACGLRPPTTPGVGFSLQYGVSQASPGGWGWGWAESVLDLQVISSGCKSGAGPFPLLSLRVGKKDCIYARSSLPSLLLGRPHSKFLKRDLDLKL
ncbi:hypothetical protein H8959_003556 [Pygathrix nigripes]